MSQSWNPRPLACQFLLASVVDTPCTARYTRRPRAHQRSRLWPAQCASPRPKHKQHRERCMTAYSLISADLHIVEPPGLYSSRIESKFLDRAPRMEWRRTRTGRGDNAWYVDGLGVGTVGLVIQAGKRFEDPTSIDFLGVWEDVRKAAYEPQAMLEELEMDGVWGACLQPSQGLFWYRLP